MRDFEIDARTIVAGVDQQGAHIFVVRPPGIIDRHDSIGFASVGYGARHALSQFMFSKYVFRRPLSQALFTIYYAKKRSEAAPSVGAETDMFIIGPHPAGFVMLPQGVSSYLDGIYKETKSREDQAAKDGQDHLESLLQGITKEAQKQGAQQVTPAEAAIPEPKTEDPGPKPDGQKAEAKEENGSVRNGGEKRKEEGKLA